MESKTESSVCVLCCGAVPQATHWQRAPSIVSTVDNFIRQTLIDGEIGLSVNVGQMVLGPRAVTLCDLCLIEVEEATEAGHKVEEYEEIVRHLQQRLLRMMRELQELVEIYAGKMQVLEEKISESEGVRISEKNGNAHKFRSDILRVAQTLKEFGEELDTKTGNFPTSTDPPEAFASPEPAVELSDHDDVSDDPPSPNGDDNDPDFDMSPPPSPEDDQAKVKAPKPKRVSLTAAFATACPNAASIPPSAKNLNLTCDVCLRSSFSTRQHLYSHWWQEHSGRRKWGGQCPTCGKTLCVSVLKKHKPKCAARGVRPWLQNANLSCDTCGAADFKSQLSLDKHVFVAHGGLEVLQRAFQEACPNVPAPDAPFTADVSCGVCGKSGWSSRWNLYRHWKNIHYRQRRLTVSAQKGQPRGQYNCDLCPETGFQSAATLAVHKTKSHNSHAGNPFAVFSAACPSAPPKENTAEDLNLRCDICGKEGIRSRRLLYKHWYRTHWKIKIPKPRPPQKMGNNLSCDVCAKSGFENYDRLYKHWRATHSPSALARKGAAPELPDAVIQCDVCGQADFPDWGSLYKHKIAQHPERLLQCDICGKDGFRFESTLRCHIQVKHGTNQKIWPCSQCGKTFNRESALQYHEDTHKSREERAHVTCPLCHRRILQTSWRRHQQVACPVLQAQRKEDPRCGECGKTFRNESSLAVHQKRMHDPENLERRWECGECGNRFKLEKEMRRHEASQHGKGDLPHKCEGCGRAFKMQFNLENHQKKCGQVEEMM